MARHHLVERAPRKALLDVVSDVCGLHAQLMSSAELTAWARVADLEPDAVASALADDRSLVKSWAMRGTLHLLPPSEYGLWLGGLSTYRHYLKPAWSKGFGISQDELKRMIAAVAKALDGEAAHPGGAGRRGGPHHQVARSGRQAARAAGAPPSSPPPTRASCASDPPGAATSPSSAPTGG